MTRTLLGTLVAVLVSAPAAGASILPAADGACVSIFREAGCRTLTPAFNGDFDGYSEAIAMSADGRSVYYLDGGRGRTGRGRVTQNSTIYVLRRDAATGALRPAAARGGGRCVSSTGRGGCARGRSLDVAWDIALSPDGRFLYVASYASAGVAIFRRNTTTGALRQLDGRAGCLRSRPRRKQARERCTYLENRFISDSVELTPDGRLAYVGGIAFRRDIATGALRPATSRLVQADGLPRPESLQSVGGGAALQWTPDGRFGLRSDDAGVFVYTIASAAGKLRQVGCAPPKANGKCPDSAANPSPTGALSPDGRVVHVATGSKVGTYLVGPEGALTAAPGIAEVDTCVRPDGTRLPTCQPAEDLVVRPDGTRLYVLSSLSIVELVRDPATGALSHGVAGTCVVSTDSGEPGPCAAVEGINESFTALPAPDSRSLLLHVSGGVTPLRLG